MSTSPIHPRWARRRLVATALALAISVGATACGDDADDSDESTASVSSDAPAESVATEEEDSGDEYCALIEEIGDELPTDEQFDQILAVAPDEISENLEIVVAAFREDPEGAFADPAVAENFPAVETYESTVCGGEAPAEIDPDAQLVPVGANEYAFDLPATPDAGAVSFVISNEGDEIHEMILARLLGDATVDDALAAEDPVAEGLVEDAGFAGNIAPGAEAVLNADLISGRYVVVCFIPAPDGVPHVDKGMISEFTVA